LNNGLKRTWKKAVRFDFRSYPEFSRRDVGKPRKPAFSIPCFIFEPWNFRKRDRSGWKNVSGTQQQISTPADRITFITEIWRQKSQSFSSSVEGYNMYFKETPIMYCV
jgi:hypothetical protein